MYRCEATTVEGFVQQLAVSYLGNGYYFYVTGWIPEGKDARAVDEKLVSRYGVDMSKWCRARKKRAGQASIQYMRQGRFFVLLATHGRHRFFEDEAKSIRDARRVPIKFGGYSISVRGGHPHVRIERERYKEVKAYFVERATHRSAQSLVAELEGVPFERYAPVRRQLLNILRGVNRVRKVAGFSRIRGESLRLRRRIVRPFGARGGSGEKTRAGVWPEPGPGPILSGVSGTEEVSHGWTQGRDEKGAVYALASEGHDRGPGDAPGGVGEDLGG